MYKMKHRYTIFSLRNPHNWKHNVYPVRHLDFFHSTIYLGTLSKSIHKELL